MARNSEPPLGCSTSGCPVCVREPCDTDGGQRWRWGSSCFRGRGTPLEWSRSLGPVGPAWSSQGHICGPPLPRTKPPPPPRHVCPLGPGLAFLIPQPCRSSLFFFLTSPLLSTLSHLLTYLRIGPRALWAVAGPRSFATCLPSAGPGLSSGAVLRSTSFPPPWGSSPEHPSYILRSQEAGEPQKRLGGLTMASSSWSTRVYMCVISVRLFHLCRPCRPFSEPGDLF